MKFAVYVEGKAEMLFVADVLSKYSNYDSQVVGFQCINLNSDDFEYVQYPAQGDENSESYYQIVNVNNDNRVISKLKQDIPNLTKQGFEIIIGLRDVFGADYDTICNKQQVIDRELIAEMYAIQSEQIRFDGVDTKLHFAIMECFIRIHIKISCSRKTKKNRFFLSGFTAFNCLIHGNTDGMTALRCRQNSFHSCKLFCRFKYLCLLSAGCLHETIIIQL